MLGDYRNAKHVYLVTGYTDMRKGIEGLASIIQYNFMLDPCDHSLYLFCGRRADTLKALYWEDDGFVLLYKRLADGKFKWPRNEKEALNLTQQQFRWLLEGLSIEQEKAIKKVDEKRLF